jgi:hypothetical protein
MRHRCATHDLRLHPTLSNPSMMPSCEYPRAEPCRAGVPCLAQRAKHLIRPEGGEIATDAPIIQNSQRLVICFFPIPQQQIGQIVENEPPFILIDRRDHMVKMVASIVYDNESSVKNLEAIDRSP